MPQNSKQMGKAKKIMTWERTVPILLLGVFIGLFYLLFLQVPKFRNGFVKAREMIDESKVRIKSRDDLCNNPKLTEVIQPDLIKSEEHFFSQNNCVSIIEKKLNNEESSNIKKNITFIANKKILVTLSNSDNIGLWDITAENESSATIFLTNDNSPLKDCKILESTENKRYLPLSLYKNNNQDIFLELNPQNDAVSEPCLSTGNNKLEEPIKISSIAFDQNSNNLAIGMEDGTIGFWKVNVEADTKEKIFTKYSMILQPKQDNQDKNKDQDKIIPDETITINTFAFSHDGKYLASSYSNGTISSNDKTIRLWKISDDKQQVTEKATISLHYLKAITNNKRQSKAWITALAFSPKNNILAIATSAFRDIKTNRKNRDGFIQLWQIDDNGKLKKIGSPAWSVNPKQDVEYRILSLDFSPDGNFLASGSGSTKGSYWDRSYEGSIKLWKIGLNAEKAMIPLETELNHQDWVNSVKFSPTGEILASASDDKTVKIWDVRNSDKPTELTSLSDFSDIVSSVVFSPDGKTLAIMSNDKEDTIEEDTISNDEEDTKINTTIKLWQLQ